MNIADLAKLLSKVDPGRVKALFPDKADEDRFLQTRQLVKDIIESVRSGAIDPATLEQLERASGEFRALYSRLSPKTQLASRAAMNEAVLWAEVGLLERGIFLSGIARAKNLQEPYRSQINSLPSHACCARYRQLEIVLHELSSGPHSTRRVEVVALLQEMRRSYLAQFVFFAGQAFVENADHPMAAYKHALACLMRAFDLEESGRATEAGPLVSAAYGAMRAVPEPRSGTHFMDLQYHEMNYTEFLTFERMSKRHTEVRERLKHLAARAADLKREGKANQPRLSFAFAPVVGWGARSASVVGIVLSAAPLLGWDQATIQASVDALWMHAIGEVPAVEQSILAAHTGGLAAHTGGLASHTGGIATLAST